ncbi:hypothetical protein L0128_16815 [candidate division KSB1 bacterium]|nr:hypothetical protein [candidate division KSB1 bacterium]
MRYFGYASLLFLLLFADQSYSQKIIKKTKKYVVLDINQAYGLKVNDKAPVFKKTTAGEVQKIGLVQIMLFKKGKCVAQILREEPPFKIGIGDFIDKENSYELKKERLNAAGYGTPARRNTWAYLSFGAGLVVSGLGYHYFQQAHQSYQDYEAATTSADAVNRYDQTVRLDNQAKLSFGVGGGLAAVGLIALLINRRHTVAEAGFSVAPLTQPGQVGFSLSWNFKRPLRF